MVTKLPSIKARRHPAARRLWAWAYRDYVELWLLTDPIDTDTELHLYGVSFELYDRYPKTDIRFHLLNPRYFEELDPDLVIPPGAEEIPLHPA